VIQTETETRPTMVNVFAEEDTGGNPRRPSTVDSELLRLGEQDERIVVLSADMRSSLSAFRERFPHRYFEFGIAETNVVSVAAGMAASGLIPYVVSMAAFGVLKCGEQIRNDVTTNLLPVRFISRMSGLAMGYFGPTHLALEDLAIARSLANLAVATTADDRAIGAMLEASVSLPGPMFIRVSESGEEAYGAAPQFTPGKFNRLRDGGDATVIATGNGVGWAMAAARQLEGEGISVRVLDAAWIKPFDEASVLEAAAQTGGIVTIEEHYETSGIGSLVAMTLGKHGVAANLRIIGLPDGDLMVAAPATLYEHYGLTADGIAASVRQLLQPASGTGAAT
jgi:transketolase